MKKSIFFLVSFFAFATIQAQKVISRSLHLPDTGYFIIITDNCFKVTVTTTNSDTVSIQGLMEGEYGKYLVLQVDEEGTTAIIQAGFPEGFTDAGDKLGAHKVVSIALDIALPQFRKVLVSGTNSSVHITGKYQDLQVVLSDGSCELQTIGDKVEVTTHSGPITAWNVRGRVTAESKFGKVNRGKVSAGRGDVILNSTLGNIHINYSE